jgi:hypothetical protein
MLGRVLQGILSHSKALHSQHLQTKGPFLGVLVQQGAVLLDVLPAAHDHLARDADEQRRHLLGGVVVSEEQARGSITIFFGTKS